MVKKILTNAGFIENETYKETRFITPPRCTYALYNDSYERRGADGINLITDHDYTIELYAYRADPVAESRIETALDNAGIEYSKTERTWIQSESLYLTTYDFNFIEK